MTSSNKRLKMDTIIDQGVKNVKNIMDALLEDIRVMIANKLNLEDFLRFSVVCKSWHSTTMTSKKILPLHLRPQLPWLMFFSKFGNPKFLILSHANNNGNHKILRLKFPEIIHGSQCVGSNRGWLIMVHEKGPIFLLNPLTKAIIELPPLATIPNQHSFSEVYCLVRGFFTENFINKAMLVSAAALATNNFDMNNKNVVSSVATMKDNYVVIAIYSNNALAFYTPLNKRWTALGLYYRDAILYNGKLYAITDQCDLRLVELAPCPRTTSCNIHPPTGVDLTPPTGVDLILNPDIKRKEREALYLVECSGDLLIVVRSCRAGDLQYCKSLTFQVFKLDLKNLRWIQVEDLGDHMLFIGKSTSSSASTRDYPQFRENCIYFTYDETFDRRGRRQVSKTTMGPCAFHLKDNKIEPFLLYNFKVSPSPPIWFAPSSC